MPTSTAGNWNSLRGRLSGGFTLIELMVVMIILAVVAGMILPSLRVQEGATDLERAANRLNGAVNEARSRAVLTRQPHQLVFYRDHVVLMPENMSSALPGGVTIVSIEVEGDERNKSVLPKSLPFQARGICAQAAIVLREDTNMTLLVRPLLLDTLKRHGIFTLSQLTD